MADSAARIAALSRHWTPASELCPCADNPARTWAARPPPRRKRSCIAWSVPTLINRKVVAITGASAGVGRAAAQAFCQRGYSVGLIARGRAGLEGARRAVESAGGRAVVAAADVANAEQVEQAAVA